MSDINNVCPNCGRRLFSYSKRRDTYLCSHCGYESKQKKAVASEITYLEAMGILPAKDGLPVTLSANQVVSLRTYIDQLYEHLRRNRGGSGTGSG